MALVQEKSNKIEQNQGMSDDTNNECRLTKVSTEKQEFFRGLVEQLKKIYENQPAKRGKIAPRNSKDVSVNAEKSRNSSRITQQSARIKKAEAMASQITIDHFVSAIYRLR